MRALVVESLSPDLSGVTLTDLPTPARAPGEVLVRVRAASLNFPDLLMTRGEYQMKPELPFVPGLEFAGEVVEADPDSGFAAGDRVYGGNKTGAFAEYAVVPLRSVTRMPHGIGFPAAAALGAAYGTAYTGLVEIGGLKAGQWVLIHGASGGVGLAAVELAKRLGAHVIATTGSPEKVERLKAASQADAVILAEGRFREAVSELTGGALCDLVYDPVGGDVFDESVRCIAFDGRLLVVGFTSGRIPSVSANMPLIKGFSVVGVRAGEYGRQFPEKGRENIRAIHAFASEGKLRPHVCAEFPLSETRAAMAMLQERRAIGKVVVRM